MKLILLSGGSGTRLWPLSNDSRSKQFLRVLPAPGGGVESMVQRLWRQVGEAGLREKTHIVTGKDQAEMMTAQLGGSVPLIVEPERRDTYAAILLAAAYTAALQDADPNETVVVMPIDPFVDECFFRMIALLEMALDASGSPLALIGVQPSHPSEKYGYIVTGERSGPIRTVRRFTEKPAAAEAARLIAEGALWNCGVFAGRLSFYTGLLAARGLPRDYAGLREHYGELPKISFDYEVVERLSSLAVLPYDGPWKDLGTWNTLTEEMRGPVSGPGVLSADSSGTHIVNELGLPIKVLGAPGLIVAASPDGILIADKEASPRIKEVLGEAAMPMYAERRWGWYRVLEHGLNTEGREVTVTRIAVLGGQALPLQLEERRELVWTVTSGSGEAVLDGRLSPLCPGDHLRIGPGVLYSLRALGELHLIETAIGTV